ncbi:inositol-1-monophosphatase [Pantoea sp. Mhis]|uniref:inositol-1-monophosphatase n=1 Tax=Pantoea sp. Mhis TaxID=2576759 RepID=UPI00135B2DBF|nr:inositol-1-monophosphatase [Pantoea sp. Mhis]MXP56601.1 inositol-1-monophosphatase [Pantoea sp. Mhis]
MHPMLNIAVRATRKAGNFIVKNYEIPNSIEDYYNNRNHLVTSINRDAEHLIIEVIRRSYPQHCIFSKVNGTITGQNKDIQWIIDPLDGTANFIKRFPHFSISIAAQVKGRTEIAVIYDPIRNDLFTAVRGQGAQLNGCRLRGSNIHDLEHTTLVTAFPNFDLRQQAQTYFKLISKLFTQSVEFRCTGASALNLAYVASGCVDGYFEIGLKLWNFAAGELLVRESSGIVTDFNGTHNYISSGNIVAGNLRIVKNLLLNIR